MGSVSCVYISLAIHGILMIYITFERESPTFSNTIARTLVYRIAVQQRQLRTKWLLCSKRFIACIRGEHEKNSREF